MHLLLFFGRALALVDVSQFVALIVRPDLRQQRQRLLFVRLLQQLQSLGHVRASAVGILRHLVQPLAVVVVLQLAEWLHGLVQIVVDDGKSVARRLEGLPARESQVLRIIRQLHATLQDVSTAQGRERVQIQSDNQVGIVRHQRRQLVVNRLVVVVQLVELCEVEVEVAILVII